MIQSILSCAFILYHCLDFLKSYKIKLTKIKNVKSESNTLPKPSIFTKILSNSQIHSNQSETYEKNVPKDRPNIEPYPNLEILSFFDNIWSPYKENNRLAVIEVFRVLDLVKKQKIFSSDEALILNFFVRNNAKELIFSLTDEQLTTLEGFKNYLSGFKQKESYKFQKKFDTWKQGNDTFEIFHDKMIRFYRIAKQMDYNQELSEVRKIEICMKLCHNAHSDLKNELPQVFMKAKGYDLEHFRKSCQHLEAVHFDFKLNRIENSENNPDSILHNPNESHHETKTETPIVRIDQNLNDERQTLSETFQDFMTQISTQNTHLESMSNSLNNFQQREQKKFNSQRPHMNSYGNRKRHHIPYFKQNKFDPYAEPY